MMSGTLTIARLTLQEAGRRRVLLAAMLFGLAFLTLFGIGFHFVHRDVGSHGNVPLAERRIILNFFTMANSGDRLH